MDRTNGSQEPERPPVRRGLSRARFLRLIGAGAGLPLIAASRGTASSAQTTGTPEILTSGEYPIGLWWPPPPEETTVARYQEIAAAGFNFVIGGNGVTNDASIPDALGAAAANDLRLLLTDARGELTGFRTSSVAAPLAPARRPRKPRRRRASCNISSRRMILRGLPVLPPFRLLLPLSKRR